MHSLRHYINLIESANLALEAKIFWTPEKIDDLKILIDRQTSHRDIAEYFGVSIKAVEAAIFRYYPERSNKRQLINWTDKMIADLKRLSDQQTNTADMAEYFGVSTDAVTSALKNHYPEREKVHTGNKGISLDDAKKMFDQWILGRSLSSISRNWDIAAKSVLYWIKKYCNEKGLDYETFKQQHLANAPTYQAQQAQKKIVRPGTQDNLKSKGPGSRHRAGYTGKQY